MKYLQDDALAEVTALLTDCPVHNNVRSNSRRVHGRLEAYTMKRAKSDKKYAVQLGHRFNEQQQQQYDMLAAASVANTHRALTQRKRSLSTGDYSYESKRTKHETHRATLNRGVDLSTVERSESHVPPPRRGRSISLDLQQQRSASQDDHALVPWMPGGGALKTTPRTMPHFKALSLAAARERDEPTSVNLKLLTDLILTLNHSFPDYDFCTATSTDFTVSSLQTAVTRINERLSEVAAAHAQSVEGGSGGASRVDSSSLLSKLWTAVDKVITLSQVSTVYSYQPDENGHDDALSFLKASLSNSSYQAHRDANVDLNLVRLDHDTSDGVDENATNGIETEESEQVLWTFNYFFVNKQTKRILLFTCIETMMRSLYDTEPLVQQPHAESSSMTRLVTNSIPEHDSVVDMDATLLSPLAPQHTRVYHHRSPSLASSVDDSDTDTVSSAISVDFDLDPAHVVSGGIPIGTA